MPAYSIKNTHNDKLLPLESLRGIAALSVALHNFFVPSLLTDNAFIHYSYLMVDFFFVLSGYVIALNYANKLKSGADLKKFQMRRFWRLYPLHFALLMFYVLLELAKYIFILKTGAAASYAPFEKNNLFTFINNIFLTHGIFPDVTSFNSRSWSISVEFYTYLIFALLLILAGRKAFFYVAAAVSLISLAILLYFTDTMYLTSRFALIRCTYSFFLGVIAYLAQECLKRPTSPWLMFIFSILSILAIIYLGPTQYIYFIPLIFAFLIFFTATAERKNIFYRLLSAGPLVYLGTISYSIYMVHGAVWFFIRQSGRFIFKLETAIGPTGEVTVHFPTGWAEVVTIGGIITTILVSHFTYKHIEMRFSKGLRANMPTAKRYKSV